MKLISTRLAAPRGQRPAARIAVAIIAGGGLVLLAACGGSPSSTGSGGSSSAGGPASAGGSANSKLVAYSQCMRSHGVPNYPDPANGALPKGTAQAFGVGNSQFQAAQGACEHLLPATGGSLSATSIQQC